MTEMVLTEAQKEQTKNIYLKAVQSMGGRLTESGKLFVDEINTIFASTELDELAFQGVVATIATERYGAEYTDEQRDYVITSLHSFIKGKSSPFTTAKVGRYSVIRRK